MFAFSHYTVKIEIEIVGIRVAEPTLQQFHCGNAWKRDT